MNYNDLSNEQKMFIDKALKGENILVNACIGSGKTTTIQCLCNCLPKTKKILYLTYNRLLKLDAQSKIKNKNAFVTNYHGFAFKYLMRSGIRNVSKNDTIKFFNTVKPSIDKFDVLIIDEYQDIMQEFTEMLYYIKSLNSNMQILAVGDMDQKIYDWTNLDVMSFIEDFLDEPVKMEFTYCFRLPRNYAAQLGRIWKKPIVGVNKNCRISTMTSSQVITFLKNKPLSDILCLGSRSGDLSRTLNSLEKFYPKKFNKNTVYASINESDSFGKQYPTSSDAIFTTYDSSKGMERKICVVFDFTETYWNVRLGNPQQSFDILRNIFCVAASRGKEEIIFVKNDEDLVGETTLTNGKDNDELSDVFISTMFDFKYREHVVDCFKLLHVEKIDTIDNSIIESKTEDGLIDLSPCIGIYLEAMYFKSYNIDADIMFKLDTCKDMMRVWLNRLWDKHFSKANLEEKVLFLISIETRLERYRTQVDLPFISQETISKISKRLSTMLSQNEEVQSYCRIEFADSNNNFLFSANGFTDVIKDNIVYELKFVSELTYTHFLQCACYMIALGLEQGILWNVRDNKMYKITIPNKDEFMNKVAIAVTKGVLSKYTKPKKKSIIKTTNSNNKEYEIGDIIHFSDGTSGVVQGVVLIGKGRHLMKVNTNFEEKYIVIEEEIETGRVIV